MDGDSVAMFLPEEPERKRSNCKPGRRFFCILALIAFLTLTILFSVVLGLSVMNTNRYESLKEQYDNLRNGDEGKIDYSRSNIELKSFVDRRINASDFTWKRELDARLASIVTDGDNQQSYTNSSFENITKDVDNLVSTVDKLTMSLSRDNTTSDRNIRRLRNILEGIKGDLNQTRIALRKVNGSLRNDMTRIDNRFSDAVKNLKVELGKLSRLNTANNNELWESLNKTNIEFEQALVQLANHSTNLNLTVNYHSEALYSRVNIVAGKIDLLSKNLTIVAKKDRQYLEKVLNKTRHELEVTFRKAIARTSTDLSKKIKNSETQLKSSLVSVKTKVDNVQTQLETNITKLKEQQKNIEDDLSKTKVDFQVVDSRHQGNISALTVKIKSVTNTNNRLKDDLDTEKSKRLKLEKDLQDLRSTVEKHLNSANGTLGMNFSLVLVFLVSAFMCI